MASAQTFVATPDPLKTQELAWAQANEVYIFFENNSGDTLQLRWKKVEASYPASWNMDLCDYGTCYVGIPANGLMNPAGPPQQPYLKLIVQPDTFAGAGWLWFRVWEDGNPANFSDVYFNLFTTGTLALSEAPAADLRAYPNPAKGMLQLENNSDQTIPATLLDAVGKTRWAGALAPGQTCDLPTGQWPAGTYLLKTNENTRIIVILN